MIVALISAVVDYVNARPRLQQVFLRADSPWPLRVLRRVGYFGLYQLMWWWLRRTGRPGIYTTSTGAGR